MRRAVAVLDLAAVRLLRFAAGLAFAVLCGAVLVQVVGRSVVGISPVWTEELTRFALLWLAACGAGLALRSGDLVNVDLVVEALPRPLPWAFRLLAALATLGFALVLLAPAWRFVSIGAWQTSPAMGLRMDWVHLSVWVMLAGLALFAALRVAGMLTGASEGLPEREAEVETGLAP
jgi:TRAP-type C4-dicarboxylate transport system permease small subunit